MKNLTGTIIKNAMTKASVVAIKSTYRHPLYGKILKKTTKVHAQNEINAQQGDQVIITACRPIAKTIHYKISQVITKK